MQSMNNFGESYYNVNDFDITRVFGLGFSQNEIDIVVNEYNNYGNVLVQRLANMGIEYNLARRLKYLYDICIGRVTVVNPRDIAEGRVNAYDGVQSLSKHLRKINLTDKRITINSLRLSDISCVPRYAVIGGIDDSTFEIYNSSNYKGKGLSEMIYKVISISSARLILETNKRPVLKYKQPKKVDGVIEILDEKENGNLIIGVSREYTRLLNRFVITASINKAPEFHCGMIQMLAFDGTKVNVYASVVKGTGLSDYHSTNNRIYDYGFLESTIQSKLMKTVQKLKDQVGSTLEVYIEPTKEFKMFDTSNLEDNTDKFVQD